MLLRGRVWGMAQSLGDLLDVLALLCILRVEEHESAEPSAIDGCNDSQCGLEFPDDARWEVLKAMPPERFAEHLERRLFPIFKRISAASPLLMLPQLCQPERFFPAAYQGAMTLLDSPSFSFERFLELERGENRMALEDKVTDAFSGWKAVGEFVTPSRVADLMIDLAAPKPGERIYNPCAGFGTLLVRTAKRIIIPALRQASPAMANTVITSTFFGVEQNPRICLVALARLMLAGITRPRLELGDVLERPMPDAGQNSGFDCILCNTPIGSGTLPEQAARFGIRSRSTETLVLQHILAHLRPGGRAVVLMPEAFLYRPGAEELLRKRLVRDYRLEAVVSVPEGEIHGLGGLRTSLLVVHRQERAKCVAFISAKTTQEVLLDYKASRGENVALSGLLKNLRCPVPAQVNPSLHEEPAIPYGGVVEGKPTPLFDLVPVASISERRWKLIAEISGYDELEVLLDAIKRLYKHTEIRTLKDLGCSIWSGMKYLRSDIVNEKAEVTPEGTEDVRLVRIRDLRTPSPSSNLELLASPTMVRLTARGIERASKHNLLREGDILMSDMNRLDPNVAIVGSGGPKMIAAKGISVVRVSDAALVSYLPRLFKTFAYRQWLQFRVIDGPHTQLTIEDLNELRVPVFAGGVPPEAIRQLSPERSLESLIRFLEGKPGFPATVRFLLDEGLVSRWIQPAETGMAKRELFKAVVSRLDEMMRDGTIHEGTEQISRWLGKFHEAAARLLDVFDLPRGTERFASLQAWKIAIDGGRTELRIARDELEKWAQAKPRGHADSSVIRKILARTELLLDALVEAWKADFDAHLNSVKLNASLSPALVSLGTPAEVSIAVTNDSELPLRKLTFETRPFESKANCHLLKPGTSYSWPVKVVGTQNGKRSLFISWSGRRMDESEATGEIELAFEVMSSRTSSTVAVDPGENPYIYRRLPEGKHEGMFYGREEEIGRILENLDRPSATTILLVEGNRGIGKTWLLKHLINSRLPAIWVPVFIDFQDFEGESSPTARAGIPTRNIFIGMARELIIAARKALPRLELPGVGMVPPVNDLGFPRFLDAETPRLINPDQPWSTFKTLFHLVRAALAPRRLLLVLEEFDRIQNGIESKITSDQVPENLRHLFQHQGEVAGIFTGSRMIRRLREVYWNMLFCLGEPVTLRGLEPAEARLLVEKPVSGRLVYAEEALDRIIRLTAGQPLLIQGICHQIFALCKQRQLNSVSLEMAEEVVKEKTTDNEHFETLWSNIHPERRRCLVFMVDEFSGKDVAVSFNVLRTAMEEQGLPYSRQELEGDLRYLLESDILGVERHDRQEFYRLEVPMFALWLQRNKDFNQTLAAAKDEIL